MKKRQKNTAMIGDTTKRQGRAGNTTMEKKYKVTLKDRL